MLLASQPPWTEVYSTLAAADARSPLPLDELEQLAVAAYLTGKDEESVDLLTRAHYESLRLGDVGRAVRRAFWMALQLMNRGEAARGSGWLATAQRLLERIPEE